MRGIKSKKVMAGAAIFAMVGLGGGTAVASNQGHARADGLTDLSGGAPAAVDNVMTGPCWNGTLVTEEMKGYLWDDTLDGADYGAGTSMETFVGTVRYTSLGRRRRSLTLAADYEATVIWTNGYTSYTDQFVGTGPDSGMAQVPPSDAPGWTWFEDATGSPSTSPQVDICNLLGLQRTF